MNDFKIKFQFDARMWNNLVLKISGVSHLQHEGFFLNIVSKMICQNYNIFTIYFHHPFKFNKKPVSMMKLTLLYSGIFRK